MVLTSFFSWIQSRFNSGQDGFSPICNTKLDFSTCLAEPIAYYGATIVYNFADPAPCFMTFRCLIEPFLSSKTFMSLCVCVCVWHTHTHINTHTYTHTHSHTQLSLLSTQSVWTVLLSWKACSGVGLSVTWCLDWVTPEVRHEQPTLLCWRSSLHTSSQSEKMSTNLEKKGWTPLTCTYCISSR